MANRRSSRFSSKSVVSYAEDSDEEAQNSRKRASTRRKVPAIEEYEAPDREFSDDDILWDTLVEEDSEEGEEEQEFSSKPTINSRKRAKAKPKGRKRNLPDQSDTLDDEENSITQGCFLIAPKQTRKNRDHSSDLSGLLATLLAGQEGEKFLELRAQAYQYHWELIKEQIQNVRNSVYESTFDGVKQFICGSESKSESDYFEEDQMQLPTAVIIVGMNVLDHKKLLSDLVTLLETPVHNDREFGPTMMITLQSKDCSTSAHALLALISQCMTHPINSQEIRSEAPTSRTSAAIRQLLDWYPRLCRSRSVPVGSITVGVLLLDFECFTVETAQLLVLLCSNHLDSIPFKFVIGLATSVASIHQMLPRSVCSRLRMEKFRFLPPNEQLKRILQSVFLDRPPIVQLGFQSLQVLFDRFEEANVSIESFSRSLQFAFMEHFFKNPLSFLTLHDVEEKDPDPTSRKLAHELSSPHYTYIRSLPSVRLAFTQMEPAKAKLLKQNDAALEQYVAYWMNNILRARRLFSVSFQCYANLPYFSHEKSKEYLHFLYLFAHHPDPLQRFHILRQSYLKKRLKRSDVALHVLDTWRTILEQHQNEFEKVLMVLNQLCKLIRSQQDGMGSPLTEETFKKLRKFITKFLHQYMRPYAQFPLHEAFIYDDSRVLQQAFTPQLQTILRQSLLRPDIYLGSLPLHRVPEICLAFSFYEEKSKRINLYDWYVQFMDSSAPRKETSDETQARYLRALTELQLLGFIQPKNSNFAERCI